MADILPFTGSGSDVISMTLGLSEAMSPEKGFAYNLCTFQIDLTDSESSQQKNKQPASAATSTDVPKPSTATTPPQPGEPNVQSRPGPVIFVVRSGSVGESGGITTAIEIGIQEFATKNQITGIVVLRKLEDFSSFWNSLSIEVSVTPQSPVPKEALLVIKGLINPGGGGYAHFVGAVLIRAKSGGTGMSFLTCEPKFITQAPSRAEGGYGVFGKVVETSAYGSYLQVHMYRASLFQR